MDFAPDSTNVAMSVQTSFEDGGSASSTSECSDMEARERRFGSIDRLQADSIPPHTEEESCRGGTLVGPYQLMQTVGKGNFAVVKLALHRALKAKVAMKIMNKDLVGFNNLEKVSRELKAMRQLDHPHIIKLYQILETDTKIYMVLEYASRGEVFDYISTCQAFPEVEAKEVFWQLVCAVNYCHTLGIVHRDLKAENLLLDDQFKLKVADFGFCNFFAPDSLLSTHCGSPQYAAPELFKGELYDGPLADVWSLGVILYILVCGSFPFPGESLGDIRLQVLRGLVRFPFFLSTPCEHLIRSMLHVDTHKRAKLTQVMTSSWLLSSPNVLHYQQMVQRDLERSRLRRFDQMVKHQQAELSGEQSPSCCSSREEITLDSRLLDTLVLSGHDREAVIQAVKEAKFDDNAAAYHLLFDKRKRWRTLLDNVRKEEKDENCHDYLDWMEPTPDWSLAEEAAAARYSALRRHTLQSPAAPSRSRVLPPSPYTRVHTEHPPVLMSPPRKLTSRHPPSTPPSTTRQSSHAAKKPMLTSQACSFDATCLSSSLPRSTCLFGNRSFMPASNINTSVGLVATSSGQKDVTIETRPDQSPHFNIPAFNLPAFMYQPVASFMVKDPHLLAPPEYMTPYSSCFPRRSSDGAADRQPLSKGPMGGSSPEQHSAAMYSSDDIGRDRASDSSSYFSALQPHYHPPPLHHPPPSHHTRRSSQHSEALPFTASSVRHHHHSLRHHSRHTSRINAIRRGSEGSQISTQHPQSDSMVHTHLTSGSSVNQWASSHQSAANQSLVYGGQQSIGSPGTPSSPVARSFPPPLIGLVDMEELKAELQTITQRIGSSPPAGMSPQLSPGGSNTQHFFPKHHQDAFSSFDTQDFSCSPPSAPSLLLHRRSAGDFTLADRCTSPLPQSPPTAFHGSRRRMSSPTGSNTASQRRKNSPKRQYYFDWYPRLAPHMFPSSSPPPLATLRDREEDDDDLAAIERVNQKLRASALFPPDHPAASLPHNPPPSPILLADPSASPHISITDTQGHVIQVDQSATQPLSSAVVMDLG